MPAERDATSVVEHEVRIAARPETVFAYFTDPVKMLRWMGLEATLDPRPGGACRVRFNAAAVMLGEYVEVDPDHRVVFTWGWEDQLFGVPPQSTRLEVSLIPDGDGTIVRLTHRQLPAVATGWHRTGWEHYLKRLAVAAAGGDAGPDSWHDVAIASREMLAPRTGAESP